VKALGAQAIAIKADVADPESAPVVIKKALSSFSVTGFDILVNNTAFYDFMPFDAITPDDFIKMFNTNVLGLIALIQALLPVILKGGRIINITSRVARVAVGGMFALYGGSKVALDIRTRDLAKEVSGPKGITINNVSPGPIETGKFPSLSYVVYRCQNDAADGVADIDLAMVQAMVSLSAAAPRMGTPGEVANVVSFLSEDGSRWITRDIIHVGGGTDML